ncbi:hypothetical protein [Mesorhizobium amorphae]|uniref:hypothetical protein n=1 Tax=Mesorhizobium amorphae TaxID=71433 RepID=UPI0011853F48|nr:hypothetical protein [Mesorhizobium amorphae]
MQLHQKGVELLVTLMDAIDHQDKLKPTDVDWLLRESALVLGELLKRDVPVDRRDEVANQP